MIDNYLKILANPFYSVHQRTGNSKTPSFAADGISFAFLILLPVEIPPATQATVETDFRLKNVWEIY
jgi:hypothetical protein